MRIRALHRYVTDTRRGLALPAVMIVLIIAMLTCAAFLELAFHEWNLATKEEKTTQAFFLAQAGVQRTLYLLESTDDWTGLATEPYSDVSLADGTYSVEFTSINANEVTILSTGQVDEHTRKITMTVSKP